MQQSLYRILEDMVELNREREEVGSVERVRMGGEGEK